MQLSKFEIYVWHLQVSPVGLCKKMKIDPEGQVSKSLPCPTAIGDNSVEEKRHFLVSS